MNILNFKRKAFGHHYEKGDGGGGGGGSTAGTTTNYSRSSFEARNGDLSSSGNYGGYTTGSSGNATSYADVSSAQQAYSSGKSSDGATLAAQIATTQAAQEAARVAAAQEAARVAAAAAAAAAQKAAQEQAARQEAARVAAEAKAAAAAKAASENTARVTELAGFSKPQVAAVAASAAEAPEESVNQKFNLAGLGKPGEDAQARAAALIGINLPDLAKQAKETGTPLSTLMSGEPNRGQLDRLQELGYGDMYGVNPDNAGQNVNNMIASSNTMGVINNAGQLLINGAIAAVPGGSLIKAGLKGLAAYESGDSFEDIAENTAWDLVGGWAAGQIQGEVMKGIGKGGRAALGDYNLARTAAGLFDVDLPSANVGGYVVGAARKKFGPDAPEGESDVAMPDGTEGENFNTMFRSGGNGNGNVSRPPVAPVLPPTAAPQAVAATDYSTNMRFNLNGAAAGRAIREGAMRRQQRQHKGF